MTGRASVSGAAFSDPETGVAVTGIGGAARLEGGRAILERLSGTTPGGGSVVVTGSVSTAGDFVADLAIALRNARVSDGRIISAQVSGDLTARGPLLATPTIGGRVDVARAEITIPERFPANAALLGIKHIARPPQVRRTLERAKRADRSGGRARAVGDLVLDLVIAAPSKIFVRGRGLDAELGGEVALRGPISQLAPVGSFRLRRGSLDVIGQRITLDAGEVRLVGTLDPTIDLRASVRARSIAVTARVTGPASDPQLVLSSAPELPQDDARPVPVRQEHHRPLSIPGRAARDRGGPARRRRLGRPHVEHPQVDRPRHARHRPPTPAATPRSRPAVMSASGSISAWRPARRARPMRRSTSTSRRTSRRVSRRGAKSSGAGLFYEREY